MKPSHLRHILFFLLLSISSLPPLVWGQDGSAPSSFEEILGQELKRLEHALDGRMGVALFRTDDPVVQAFISGGILNIPQEAYLRLETGLAAVAVLEGMHNNQKRPMCYVLYHPEKAQGGAIRGFYDPIVAATNDLRQGAAFLAAHETAHCIDHLERETLLSRHMQWGPDQAVEVGLEPHAFERVFGERAATAAYRSRTQDLYSDLAQRQYEERLADAFGLLWVWRLGAPKSLLQVLQSARRGHPAHHAHATAPVLDASGHKYSVLPSIQGIDGIWVLAREAQREAGVDPSLRTGSTVFQNPVGEALREARMVRRQATPLPPPSKPKAWNELPRFGQ